MLTSAFLQASCIIQDTSSHRHTLSLGLHRSTLHLLPCSFLMTELSDNLRKGCSASYQLLVGGWMM